MSLAEIREYFSRHFLGRVRVKRCDPPLPPPECHLLRRTVETHPIRTRMRVLSAALFSVGGMSCSHRGFRFSSQLVRVRGSRIARYVPQEIAVGRVSPLSARVLSDLGRVLRLPQERGNRLQWQRSRPKAPGEMILAWYGPIVEGAVAKLALNKQRGTLLIWYNPQSRHFNPRGLYLYRRLGKDEKPEWRWV
ncbi:hypothetical protein [uncultured Fretibacterium sp.]|uniref:hypothetical protein n=1 Tax=uncultured Fretibacterium sp. TaxID=1678694 RepID=UPI002612F903|nr:hypothetical protein [uncultured Fretibacterium sp.]